VVKKVKYQSASHEMDTHTHAIVMNTILR